MDFSYAIIISNLIAHYARKRIMNKPSVCAMIALMLFIYLSAEAGDVVQPATDATHEWPLPSGLVVDPSGFHATADAEYIFFQEIKYDPKTQKISLIYWAWHKHTGQLKRVNDLLVGVPGHKDFLIGHVAPSSDGKYVIVVAMQPNGAGQLTAYMVGLADGKVRKVGENALFPTWIGGKGLLSSVTNEGRIATPELIEPATGIKQNLSIRGIVLSASRNGRILACVCDPNSPQRTDLKPDSAELYLTAVTPKGNVVRRICKVSLLGEVPVISPSGKYMALQIFRIPPAPGRPPQGVHVLVVDIESGEKWRVEQKAVPLAVSDSGKVIMQDIVVGMTGYAVTGYAVKSWTKNGGVSKLVDHVGGVFVSGNQLIYVTGDLVPKIKIKQLKE